MEDAVTEKLGESEIADAAADACLEEGQIADECKKTQQVFDIVVAETLKTDDDVQRAIDGLKEIPDEELQEFLDDEDFMEGLDVVDAWEGEEDQGRLTKRKSRGRDKERKRSSRERIRHRERPKREDRKREESRRDPSKSTKDIERDKIRTKKDSESKILAEKEKAIKYILDSDDVVPPGTEEEAIETIAEKQNMERLMPLMPRRRSKERRRSIERQRLPLAQKWRRSPERIVRLSPYVRRRSPLLLSPEQPRSVVRLSPERRRSPLRLSPVLRRSPLRLSNDHRRSPLILSPDRRRSPLRLSPDHARKPSWERRSSGERRWSQDRYRNRTETHERDLRLPSRRSRSRDRHRSRSIERHRRRYSRSPINRRFSPRRRSRSRSRSRSNSRGRSPERRVRKRSPFINEITRQFRKEGLLPIPAANTGYMGPPLMGMIPNMMGPTMYPHEVKPVPPPHFVSHQPGPPGPGMPMPGVPSFMNFEPVPPPPMNFEVIPPQPLAPAEFSSGPVMYNDPNSGPIRTLNRITLIPQPSPSPQPVPPPTPTVERESLTYVQLSPHLPPQKSPMAQKRPESVNKDDRRSSPPYNGLRTPQKERLRTPEPPVISDAKVSPSPFGKTSLSSLLEASVSAKDSTALPVLYPGFKPEILRHCEHALRDLPSEDPRLKMKGRFFFSPKKDEAAKDPEEQTSNSILLRKERNKIFWDEEEERHPQFTVKSGAQMHQKICQTDEVPTEEKFVQAVPVVTTADFSVQVYPYDILQASKEEKRPIMDRLDWNNRETFDYAPKPREVDDLRWSLSNSAQKRPWGRAASPPRGPESRGPSGDGVSSGEYSSRSMKHSSPGRGRGEFQQHRIPNREHYSRESYSQSYRDDDDDGQDEFQDNRSDHSRGESPMVLEDSGEELDEEQDAYPRSSEWHGREKILRGRPITSYRGGRGVPRGKYLGSRPFRARASYRGKF